MSTRSRIGISQEDGSVKSIYCHYDGYPEGVGQTLMQNYTSPVEVMELINKGDLSSLHSQEHYADRGETDVDAVVTPKMNMSVTLVNVGVNMLIFIKMGNG
jgi:hypothetical protein